MAGKNTLIRSRKKNTGEYIENISHGFVFYLFVISVTLQSQLFLTAQKETNTRWV